MTWCFDIDGVITSNPHFFQWWIYQLRKNKHCIILMSARNPKRKQETLDELQDWGIKFDYLLMMDADDYPRTYGVQGVWKVMQIERMKVDIWVDNDFKVYEQVCGVNFSKCKAERISI